jgi:sugar lactone lactonase YvrE
MSPIKILLSSIFLWFAGIVYAQTERLEFEAPDCYPEGIAWHRSGDVFYVSSARMGTIGKVTPGGTYVPILQDSTLKSSYGMKVDSLNNRLLVCVGDANYSKYATPETYRKMARLIAVDLSSGKKTMDVDLAGLTSTQHFPNDLTLDDQGNIYVTDSYANVIYKVTREGKAAVFADSPLFKTAGIGLNGIVWHRDGFLLASSTGKGCLYKIDLNNPKQVAIVRTEQFFVGGDGLIFDEDMHLCLVQNQGSDKIYKLESTDNWQSAKIIAVTLLIDRFSYPATAALAGDEVWIMNAKFNELTDKNNVPSKKFAIQRAVFKPIPQTKARNKKVN